MVLRNRIVIVFFLSFPLLDAIVRLGISWKRAKHWVVSPDPAYELKKTTGPTNSAVDNTPDIALGFEDEVWWSREQQPDLHSWSEQEPLRLVQQQVSRKEPEGKVIACYGLSLPSLNQMLLRFVAGRVRLVPSPPFWLGC